MRDTWTRWFAIGLYRLMLCYVGYLIHQHNFAAPLSCAAIVLFDVLVLWLGMMYFPNLVRFD